MERMIPNNIQAEQGILGSILIDPDAYDLIADRLKVDDFYRDAHRIIYGSVLSLVSRRVTPDFVTVTDELEREEKLDVVGGLSYVTGLLNAVPTSGNVEYYTNIVCKMAEQRRLIHIAGQIATLAYSQDPNALETAEKLLFDIQRHTDVQQFYGMSEMVSDYMDELDMLHEKRGSLTGVSTGYSDLDIPTGGLQKSDFILLAGRPSSGKTALALSMAYKTAMLGNHVAIFSLEMGRRQLMRRLMAMASKVDMQRLRSGWIEDNEWDLITSKAADLSQLPIWVNDTAGNPIASIRSQLRRLVKEQGHVDQVMIDYLGLIEPDEKSENRVQEVSKISRDLKKLAREFNVPFLVLAQLSRQVEQRANKHPMLSDLRDSGSLEQDADVVLFIYRDAYYAAQEGREVEQGKENIADITIAKHRNGPTGDAQLIFKADETMFYDLEVSPPAEGEE